MRFNPVAGTMWHYLTWVILQGTEIKTGKRDTVGGVIRTVTDEKIDSSGGGLVGVHVIYNTYDSLDLSTVSKFENPNGGPTGHPSYEEPNPGSGNPPDSSAPASPDSSAPAGRLLDPSTVGPPEPMQGYGPGGGGGRRPGGGNGGNGGNGQNGGGGTLKGEGNFEITPIIESDINYIISESGRLLNLSGMDVIGDIIDPSRSITVRQVFQTTHFLVVPDYDVHLNEQWRAPMALDHPVCWRDYANPSHLQTGRHPHDFPIQSRRDRFQRHPAIQCQYLG